MVTPPKALPSLGLHLAVCVQPHWLPSIHLMAHTLSHLRALAQAVSSSFSPGYFFLILEGLHLNVASWRVPLPPWSQSRLLCYSLICLPQKLITM